MDLDGREDEWYMKAWEKTKYGAGKTVETANHIAENFVSSFVLVGSGVAIPIINQGYVISQEGIHEGGAYDRNNTVSWAVPYKVEGWRLVPQNQMMGENISYEDGKDIMNSTVNVISVFVPVKAPIKVEGKILQKGLDLVSSVGAKTPVKKAIEGGLNAIEDNSSSNTTSNQSSTSSMTYTIKKGDSLSGIAKQYNTTVDAIANQNNIQDVNKIQAGSTLTINQ